MRIAVLASADSWYARDLARAAVGRCELAVLPFAELSAELGAGNGVTCGGRRLEELEAVLVRTMPPGSLEQVVFRMDGLAALEAAGALVVNPPKAIEAAVDKYLAAHRLARAGLLVPRTVVCQTAEEGMAAFAHLGGDVVLKPLFGSEGRGITRINDEALALRAFRMLEQLGAVLYLQEYVAHEGADLRLFVLGEQVLGMRRINPHDWRTNVSRGARTEPLAVTPELAELAHRAARAVGAVVAGVDLLPAADGRLYALEVNAVPGWKALASTLNLDVAALLLEYVRNALRK